MNVFLYDNMPKRKTLEEFKKQLLEINPNIKIDGIYINNKTPINCSCIICGHQWKARPDNLMHWGCPKCRLKKIGDKNRKSQIQAIQDFITVHGDKYDYSKVKYIKDNEKVCIICPKHGEFWQTPSNHIQGHGCPKCNNSSGEILIEQFLKTNNIKYIQQFPISISTDINPSGIAKIDFYLPDLNAFIEYNGEQHYKPIKHFGGVLKFKQQQQRDNYVKIFSQNQKINLIEIRFDQSNDEIFKILKQLL